MAKHVAASLQSLRLLASKDPVLQCLAPRLSRSITTAQTQPADVSDTSFLTREAPDVPDVLTTVYSFPQMEPLRFEKYPANQLNLPLRRDILHKAIIFEADGSRQGTASTKWRDEVRGSGKKIRPQKGTGKARLGDKKSPMLRGGGRAFGPKPRDFSTKLPRKIYDLAWRTALSYRYRRGELVLIEDGADLDMGKPGWLKQIMERSGIRGNRGESLFITETRRPNLWKALPGGGYARAKTEDDIDVKDLLKLGQLVIEKGVLDRILYEHSSDLDTSVKTAIYE